MILFLADNDSTTPVASGLSAYLEDIISDEEPLEETTPPGAAKTPPPPQLDTPTLRSKEELLQLMERVDRDITSIEQQISVLEKRQVSHYMYKRRLFVIICLHIYV